MAVYTVLMAQLPKIIHKPAKACREEATSQDQLEGLDCRQNRSEIAPGKYRGERQGGGDKDVLSPPPHTCE